MVSNTHSLVCSTTHRSLWVQEYSWMTNHLKGFLLTYFYFYNFNVSDCSYIYTYCEKTYSKIFEKIDSNNTIKSPFFKILIRFYIVFFSYRKMFKHQLNIIKKQRKASNKSNKRYQDLSKEEKNEKRQYGCKRYKNLSEYEKQWLLVYIKEYNTHKNKTVAQIKTDRWCFLLVC